MSDSCMCHECQPALTLCECHDCERKRAVDNLAARIRDTHAAEIERRKLYHATPINENSGKNAHMDRILFRDGSAPQSYAGLDGLAPVGLAAPPSLWTRFRRWLARKGQA